MNRKEAIKRELPLALLLVCFVLTACTVPPSRESLAEVTDEGYLRVLEQEGEEPVDFVLKQLQEHDLLLFDDALHTAVEPWEFYQELIREPDFHNSVKRIFLEIVATNKQPHLDAFLSAPREDLSLLLPAFQDDTGGFGFRYQTYFDLMHTIYSVNRGLPEADRIRAIAVSNPTYWSEIHTPADVEIFRNSLLGRDNAMYHLILEELDRFGSGRKAVFLTNTRHAYKGIRHSDGSYYWNTGTFFDRWHPGKTYSIRIHNVTLSIERRREVATNSVSTSEGLERVEVSWVRMANGKWDRAFHAWGEQPVALSLEGNLYGQEPYVGNHMLNVAPEQTMSDAYDAILFLAPLEEMRASALADRIYTPEFKQELARRYGFLMTQGQLQTRLDEAGLSSISEYVEQQAQFESEQLLPQAQHLEPLRPSRN